MTELKSKYEAQKLKKRTWKEKYKKKLADLAEKEKTIEKLKKDL